MLAIRFICGTATSKFMGKMTFSEAINSSVAPEEVIATLVIVDIQHLGFDSKVHEGQIVIHKDLQEDVVYIF